MDTLEADWRWVRLGELCRDGRVELVVLALRPRARSHCESLPTLPVLAYRSRTSLSLPLPLLPPAAQPNQRRFLPSPPLSPSVRRRSHSPRYRS